MYSPISNPCILVHPSEKLGKFISKLKNENAPKGIKEFNSKTASDRKLQSDYKYFVTDADKEYLKDIKSCFNKNEESKEPTGKSEKLNEKSEQLNEKSKKLSEKSEKLNEKSEKPNKKSKKLNEKSDKLNEKLEKLNGEVSNKLNDVSDKSSDKKSDTMNDKESVKLKVVTNQLYTKGNLLNLDDLYWVHDYIKRHNETSETPVYFHELFEGSEVILPKNVEVERNPELEKRCQLLKNQQQNRVYQKMTKNVDNMRQKHPEDTISYQCKLK